MVRASNIIRRSTDVQCAMNRMNLLWTVPIPVELPCRGGTAGSGLVAGVGMGHVHDRRPYERTGPSAVDLILRFIADGPVIWEGWRRTAMAPPGLRLLWDRAHGPGAARGVRGAWRGGRPSAVGGAGQPAHQWFRDGVRVAGGGRQPEDHGRIPTHRVEDRRPYRAQGRRPLGILDAVHVRRSHRDRRGRDQLQEGAHVHHRGRRPQAQTGRPGARRIRQGGPRPVLPTTDRRAARLHHGGHRRRRQMDRRQREGAPAERRARARLVPHRLLDDRHARPGQETVVEPSQTRQRQDSHGDDERPEIRRAPRTPAT